MKRITAPLKRRTRSKAVADLQDGLRLLLEKGVVRVDDADQRALEARLRAERTKETYGQATQQVVALFQRQRRLAVSGAVDKRTAKTLNAMLKELGAFRPPAPDQNRIVGGQVRRKDRRPFPDAPVAAFHVGDRGLVRLAQDTTDAEGRYTIRYPALPDASPIHLRVVVFDARGKPLCESEVIPKPKPLELVDLIVPSVDIAAFHVEGKVASRVSAGVGGLRVQIVDRTVGDDVQLVEAVTDQGGAYQATFTDVDLRLRGKTRPDLQARVFAGETLLAVSDVRYDAATREVLNVLLDDEVAADLKSEHETLTLGLSDHFRGKLGDLQETDDRQDITYLANKTGWDARAVALAALADQFSARTEDARGGAGIDPAFFYALFRAGLPANESALYQTNPKTAEAIWKQAIKQSVIPARLADTLPATLEQFQTLAAQQLLEGPALVGLSPLKEVLSVSLGDDPQRQRRFADLYARHRGDMPKFWKAVRGSFDEAGERRLRLDGQLAYLTLNNARVIAKLHATAGRNGLTDTVSLVAGGYYRAEKWQALVANDPIPPEIPGEDDAEKRSRYAELLAAQVRLSFPTAVVAEMVTSGETPLASEALKDQVHAFLTEHQGQFELGMHPVEQYVAKNQLQIAPELIREITRIQRVYQVTPSDDAMNALLTEGVDSAYAVIRYDRDEFVGAFKNKVGGESNARLIHAKSQQVHNEVLNIAVSYLTASNAPAIGAHSAAQLLDPAPTVPHPHASDVIAASTLEGLFGEMDYCVCEHCRSILSPAAYLVDLLLFIDRPANPAGSANPQTVLLERRPDIQHLPLTCENTNTPLPYIDLVNETLEYYVTNNSSLVNYAGHNTAGDATPAELLANPQFVSDAAYELLGGKPAQVGDPLPLLPPAPPLPFHQPLENLRRYLERFESPLPEVMESLRKDDNLERANADQYGWRDILMEELRLSRAEYALLTDRNLTLQQLYGFPPATSGADVLASLSNARAFTRRVGISYEEIIDILKTRFVNPSSSLIPKLERLGVPFSTLKALKDIAISDEEFDGALSPHLDESQYGGDVKAWVKNETNYARIMGLITLTNPDDPGDVSGFEKLEFRYANPDSNAKKVLAFEFVRLIRFIRLWKKLGWTIEQTDKAITALYPLNQALTDPDEAVNLQRLDEGFLAVLPRLGVVKRVMETLKLKPKKDLLPLLACFAPMDTHGADSLYRQMLLSPPLLDADGVFADNGYGRFLADNAQTLTAYEEALRAAFLLTDDEFREIIEVLGYDANTPLGHEPSGAELTSPADYRVENISAVLRRGWLARKLKLSVREFLLLCEFTDLDPFAAPDPADPPILRLIELRNRFRAVSLKPTEALYLIWNQDISGRSSPEEGEISDLARMLRGNFAAIGADFGLADDPEGQIARARMALVYGTDATDLFFGLLETSFVTDVPYSHGQATLEQPILDAAPDRIAYDHFRKRLCFTGVLTTAIREALKDVVGVTAEFKAAVDSLYAENNKVVGPFFSRYPELLPLYDGYVASGDPAEKKRSDLLANFLPELKRRRKRQQALQAISAAARADIEFASALLDAVDVMHAAGDDTRPALDDLTALEAPGLSAQFFFRNTATGAVDRASDAEANLAYAATGSNRLPANPEPANAVSGIWSGYLGAPENGFCNLRIEAEASATVALSLGDEPIPLVRNGNIWSNSAPIELLGGTLHAFSLRVEEVKDTLTVRWQRAGRGWEIIPATYLYSANLTDHLRHMYVRFLKSASLAAALELTATELAHFAAHADYHIGVKGWLNSLPVAGNPDNATSTALLTAFTALLDFGRIKADLGTGDARLLKILKDPAAATLNPQSLLFALAQWETASLHALLTRFGKTIADLAHLDTFRRVYGAYAWVKKLRVPAAALISAATNQPNAATVRGLQSALRARYDVTDWLDVLQPINDEMRGLQRDALVAYILHRMRSDPAAEHIDTPEKLFEYFLMDVEMDPCMQTSRIRHALSSIQLFIERCLMNLEPRVSPSSINAKQWQWMSRYRVWEANRKVFLYPENWLEPELRDDQSPFFKETMSELLQSDITEEAAAVALLNYLSKLEEVAKLEPCGIHYIEGDLSTEARDDIVHVVARTPGATRKYFHRRREGGYWTPWEQIKLDIEDNPVIPVVWKGRLFLFWLRILKQAPIDSQEMSTSSSDGVVSGRTLGEIKTDAKQGAGDDTKVTVQAVLCWSEYYNGKWQPAKTSDVSKPTRLGGFPPAGDYAFERADLRLSCLEESAGLRVFALYHFGGSSFLLYNTHSLPVTVEDAPFDFGAVYDSLRALPLRGIPISSDTLTIRYFEEDWSLLSSPDLVRPVLKSQIKATITASHGFFTNAWHAPFLYDDSRHVFYVTTAERVVRVWEWNEFTPTISLQTPELVMAPLVQAEGRRALLPTDPLLEQPALATIDPVPMRRFVSEDAYIRRAIGTLGTVRFGEKEIGPTGQLGNGTQKRWRG